MSSADPAPPSHAPFSPWRWGVCLLLMLATVINYMDRVALNQMALRITTYFELSDTEYGVLGGVFSFAFAIGAFTTGFIVDKVSVRWVYPLMVLGWSAAGVLTGFATTFWMLLSCRFALGFFEAGNWPCAIRTTKAILRPDERSLGNSLFGSGTALGAIITPFVVIGLIYFLDPEEPQRHAIMSVTGGTYAAVTNAPTDTWQFPFQVIGSLGVVWIVLWFSLVPRAMLRDETRVWVETGAARFRDVFRDRRFWVLFVITVSVNVTWHGYVHWLPLYLQKERGYAEFEMGKFMTLFYLLADIGTWTVGGVTLLIARRGLTIHQSRQLAFGACAAITLTSVAVPFLPDGVALEAALLVVAFGALGLFPTYFALSQEVSHKHQGKVTGTLGASAHFSLAGILPLEGWIAHITGSKGVVLGAVGVAPLLAFCLLVRLWPAERPAEPTSA